MTAEEYINQQCDAFHKTCLDMAYKVDWSYTIADIAKLDAATDHALATIWPEGTPRELENSVAIMWGSMFSKMIAGSYISKWSVDPESKVPIVVVKCGSRAIQVKAILVGAQAFNNGTLFADLAQELKDHLDSQGAEKAP